jgi:methionyl-tRNA synthetase
LFLIKEIAFGSDGDFSWDRYEEKYNVDLANNLGNLVSRVSSMAHRYRGGRLMPTAAPSERLAALAVEVSRDYRHAMDDFALHEAASAAYRLVDATNEFIAATSPWALAKDPASTDRLSQVLFDSAEAIRLAAVLLSPIMPASTAEVLRRVGVRSDNLNLDRDGHWRTDGERAIAQDGPLWPRHEGTSLPKERSVSDNPTPPPAPGNPAPDTAPSTSAPSTQAPSIQGSSAAPGPVAPASAPASERISIDDFMKVELRVAKVLAAERVPKSKRLLKLQVDVGTEVRTLVAGIAEAYEPETLIGRTVAIVFNLQPATLMGVESNGMVLAASPEGGKPMLVSFETPPPLGTRIR